MSTTPHAQPKHVLPSQGKTYRARGFLCTFKLLASDTNGAFTLSEAFNAPNTGVPPHIQLVNAVPSEQVWPSDVSTCPPM